jgi:very-short-patch-repair endonuclease
VNRHPRPRRGRPHARTSHPQDDGLSAGVPQGAPSGGAPFTGGTPPAPQRPGPSLSLGKITRDWRCLERKDQTPENGPVDGVHLLRPLRNPSTAERPHVVEHVISPELGAARDGKTNKAEARVIAALLKAATELPEYADKTFGAISLLADDQAWLIHELAVSLVDAVELEKRRFVAGNAAHFQGDERHVMFLSMVDAPVGTPLRMSQLDATKQRFNVAASRAKDQLWLVHSLDPGRDLQPGDLRRRLIEYVREPGARRRELQRAQSRAESPLEREIIQRLVGRGYSVEPQVWVGQYRIDIVVRDAGNEVAVECDGDRFHGIDQSPEDMRRQAILERAGWRFVRVRGTRFYRDPERTTEWLCEELERNGVEPSATAGPTLASSRASATHVAERVLRRAWEVMKERGWLPAPEPVVVSSTPLTAPLTPAQGS